MTHRITLVFLAAAVALLAAPAARADDVADLVAKLKPPARFADHTPAWSVTKTELTFLGRGGPETSPWWVIKDGDRYVAIMPMTGFHGGTVYVQDFRPGQAPEALNLPVERWHIDTAVGTELRTNNFIPQSEWTKDSSYQWQVDGPRLVLTRRFKGDASFSRWAHRTQGDVAVDATNTIVFEVDPVLGYVVDATYDIWTDPPPGRYEFSSAATSGRYLLWPGEATCFRHAIAVPDGGYVGYACNHGATKQHGGDMRCRDGGFVAFLNDETGWSPTMTIEGAPARLVVCGAHTDLDFVVNWPKEPETRDDGLKHFVMKHRLVGLPPELTRHVWDTMTVLHQDERKLMVRLGRLENFEDQPLPIDGRERGMPWNAELSSAEAHSGTKSLRIEGRSGHGDPQLPVKPSARYRLEAWMKVVPKTPEQLQADETAARERHAKKKEGLAKRIERETNPEKKARFEKELAEMGEFEGLGPARAYLLARLYEWTPHNPERVGKPIRTNVLEPGGGWQKVEVEFETPDWGPFIDVAFYAENCTAYLDDLRFERIGDGPPARQILKP